jgi:hypothetical protein
MNHQKKTEKNVGGTPLESPKSPFGFEVESLNLHAHHRGIIFIKELQKKSPFVFQPFDIISMLSRILRTRI